LADTYIFQRMKNLNPGNRSLNLGLSSILLQWILFEGEERGSCFSRMSSVWKSVPCKVTMQQKQSILYSNVHPENWEFCNILKDPIVFFQCVMLSKLKCIPLILISLAFILKVYKHFIPIFWWVLCAEHSENFNRSFLK